jgi:hypothetical protein
MAQFHFLLILLPHNKDGIPLSGDIESGVNIGTIEAGKFTQVTFEVEIDSLEPEQVVNKAKVQYKYKLIPSGQVFEKDVTTNEVTATLVTNCKEAQKLIIGKIGEDELAIAGEIVRESENSRYHSLYFCWGKRCWRVT